jgi:hypothetical protein
LEIYQHNDIYQCELLIFFEFNCPQSGEHIKQVSEGLCHLTPDIIPKQPRDETGTIESIRPSHGPVAMHLPLDLYRYNTKGNCINSSLIPLFVNPIILTQELLLRLRHPFSGQP